MRERGSAVPPSRAAALRVCPAKAAGLGAELPRENENWYTLAGPAAPFPRHQPGPPRRQGVTSAEW